MKEDKDYRFGYILLLSIIAAMGGFLFGYDEAVISGTVEEVQTQFALTPLMKGWFVSSALLGATIGALIGGGLSDYFGRKRTMITSAALFAISMVGCAFACNFTLLVIFRMIGGMGIGVASIVCPMYISEIAVARSRGMLVALYQLAVTIGVLGAYISNFYLLKYAQSAVGAEGWTGYIFVDEWWRGMLGVGVVPSLLFLICVLFIPESPRWLVLKNRIDRAEGILGRIYFNISEIKRQISETLSVAANSSSVGFAALLKPGIRRAVIVGVCIAMLGQFMGVNAVLYYGPTIFKDAGIGQDNAFLYLVLIGAANTITTIVAMFIIDRVGRKALIYYGVAGMFISLLAISAYFQWGPTVEVEVDSKPKTEVVGKNDSKNILLCDNNEASSQITGITMVSTEAADEVIDEVTVITESVIEAADEVAAPTESVTIDNDKDSRQENQHNNSGILLLIFFIFYIVCCAGSICAIIFVILSEMYPLAVRGIAMAVAGFALWIATSLIGQLTPVMLHNITPQGTFLFFAVCCIPYVWIMWKKVPNTTGKSLEEIEEFWLKDDLKRTADDLKK